MEGVILEPRERILDIKFTGIKVNLINKKRRKKEETKGNLQKVSVTGFTTYYRRLIKEGGKELLAYTIYTVSLENINKALKPKVKRDPCKLLPPKYYKFLNVFNAQKGKALPPYRDGVDHKIQLKKDLESNDKSPPWGPLYGISRDELLILRKTLMDLLDQGFIRVSNSPIKAPVLFIRKPGGGLRFCVDYKGLNKIIRKDRYPLPLIKKTFRNLAQAKYFTKMDVVTTFHKIRITKGQK